MCRIPFPGSVRQGAGRPAAGPAVREVSHLTPRYQTEIVVAADRYVCLQLPEGLPVGRALVTVTYPEAVDTGPSEATTFLGHEPGDDRGDVEWWEEFDAEPPSAGR